MTMSRIMLLVVLAVVPLVCSAEFKHPGVLVSKAMLDLAKTKTKSAAEPWEKAYKHMLASDVASLSFQPKARKVVECGSFSKPDNGCTDEKKSSVAAYTHALIWYYTGNIAHAHKAIEIMDAWAEVIKEHTNSNAPLETGWAGSVWPRAGDIIKHSNASWSEEKQKKFEGMLRNVYLPVVHKGVGESTNGNWHLTLIEATAAIAVFLDDDAMFENAISRWRHRVPAYIYIKSDGEHPKSDPTFKTKTGTELSHYWYDQKTYMDGLCQETCRDLGHTVLGLAATINTAETAYHQGVDLYKEAQERIVKSMEFHANHMLGASVPSNLCGGHLKQDDGTAQNFFEIGYNHYHNREGVEMPKTHEVLTKKFRPTGYHLFMAWETLTHAENGGK